MISMLKLIDIVIRAYLAKETDGNLTTGALVMPSCTILLEIPFWKSARQPLLVLATKQPSVVAIGM